MKTSTVWSLGLCGAVCFFVTLFAVETFAQKQEPSTQGIAPTSPTQSSRSPATTESPGSNRTSQDIGIGASTPPAAAPGCNRVDVEKLLNDLFSRLNVQYARGRLTIVMIDTEALLPYQQFRARVESCEEFGVWRGVLKAASKPDEIRASLNTLLEKAIPPGSLGIYISTGSPAQFRILDFDASVSSQLTILAEKIDRLQRPVSQPVSEAANPPNREASAGMSLFGLFVAITIFLLVAVALWAAWRYFFAASIDEELPARVPDNVSQRGLVDRIGQLSAEVSQLNNRVLDIRDFIKTLKMPAPVAGVRMDPDRGRLQVQPPGIVRISLDAIAAEILVDWIDARDNPKAFENKYAPVGIDGSINTAGMPSLRQSHGDLADSSLWAISSRQDDTWFVVPTPLLKPSVLSVGENRRARELFEGVFLIERGETELATLAIARRVGTDFHVNRQGVLRLPGR